MKHLLLVALCAMFCLGSAAQNAIEVTDSTNVDGQSYVPQSGQQGSMLDMVSGFSSFTAGNLTQRYDEVYPLGKRGLFKKHHIEQAIEICPTISTSKTSQADVPQNIDQDAINNTGIGLNFGYSVIFIPGYEEGGKLHLNKAGLAYSAGIIASFTRTDRYGTTCEFLGKLGLETCHNRKLGIGFDFLCGYGKAYGDLFFFNNIVEDDAPKSSAPYNKWTYKCGGQLWLKTGLLSNSFLSNTDILLFARFIKNKNPEEATYISSIHYNLWKEENWSFGVILRYRM